MRMVEWYWCKVRHLFLTLFLYSFASFLTLPAIADVFVHALCPATTNHCSLALYLTGFQQAVTGLGAVFMIPLLGNLSDVYGRKKLLLVPLIIPIFPSGILACQTTTNFVYAYYTIRMFAGMIGETALYCLALSYLADFLSEERRVSAFGILYGVIYAGSLCGTLAAKFLTIPQIFQVSTAAYIVGVVYALVLLKETRSPNLHRNPLEHPILMPAAESQVSETEDCEPSNVVHLKKIPSPKDIFNFLKRSTRFTLLAFISFFETFSATGSQAFLLYFLKARYNFQKKQFSVILLIVDISATLANMLFLPLIGPYLGEERTLVLGLFSAFLAYFTNGIAWAVWVPYAVSFLAFFYSLSLPTIKTMVSKEIGPNEQGIAQGCIAGVTSLASITSPLFFTPLSAIFFAESAPPNLTGFSILCISLTYLIGLILSIFIKMIPSRA